MQEQGIGGDQQDLEEDEEVEQVAGQEGAVEPHQLELEQRMEMPPEARVAPARRHHGGRAQHRGQQQHHGAQPVELEHDAKRRWPVPDVIDRDGARGCRADHARRDRQQQQRDHRAQHALGPGPSRRRGHQQAAGKHRQQDGQEDRQMEAVGHWPVALSVLGVPGVPAAGGAPCAEPASLPST